MKLNAGAEGITVTDSFPWDPVWQEILTQRNSLPQGAVELLIGASPNLGV